MLAHVVIGEQEFTVDLGAGVDVSIRLDFHGVQPSSFGAPPASADPVTWGQQTFSTEEGASCNVTRVSIIPHCNGTHTESVGHIVDDREYVVDVFRPTMMPCTLVSVQPERAGDVDESYRPAPDRADLLVTASSMASALHSAKGFAKGLVVRTLPNPEAKLSRNYEDEPGPFFSLEAMTAILDAGIEHLVVDFPSIDRAQDGGRMENHRRFWSVAIGERRLRGRERLAQTITEFAYIPDELADGRYLLDLQLPPFALDAAPSRPVLYKLNGYER
jgi:kynurenine formamidase